MTIERMTPRAGRDRIRLSNARYGNVEVIEALLTRGQAWIVDDNERRLADWLIDSLSPGILTLEPAPATMGTGHMLKLAPGYPDRQG